jgi:cyclic beta-1,2-glucan synthetase
MSMAQHIEALLGKTTQIKSQSMGYNIIENLDDYLDVLDDAHSQLSKLALRKKITSTGVEWFLDNYYVIQEAIELIRDDLPEDYFQKLPAISGSSGTPRIYHIAQNIIAFFDIETVQNDLDAYLTAYQEEIALNMSELWALPLMLRLSLIEILARNIFNLIEDQKSNLENEKERFKELRTDEIIARCLRTLHRFNQIDWKKFFETHSIVNHILIEDPAGIYASMDFETRDQYRKEVEGLAEKSPLSEIEVTRAAISLAQKSNTTTKKQKHVGYFLIDNGETQLKKDISYQYDFPGRVRKIFFDNKTAFYLGSISLLTIIVVFIFTFFSQLFINKFWKLLIISGLSLIPASSVAVNLINSILTTVLPPKTLPKMDFRKRVPRRHRTMVAIPALLTDRAEVDFLLRQIERHYLANKDRNIGFILLLDYSDAPEETMPEDEILRDLAIGGISNLNKRYQGDLGQKPFFLFHRCRQWNPKENLWMGWERKRGKLADFNRYLMEGFEGCIDTIIGDLDYLERVKYIITLDADTILPRGSANALIATLAHPLNQAEFDDKTGKVISGYTILQPRTEVKPTSVTKSLFTRIFAGDLGLDLYTRAVSDVYQDLIGEGIYVGKGIYDVRAFQKSLQNKVPDNTLLSHDLFEGLYGRAGLVTDIVFYEEYPPNYASHVKRLHRWVRGDWQLLPWLFPQVPIRKGNREENSFTTIDKWKIFDNLRRSLLSPTTMLSFIAGWILFGDKAWIWTMIMLLVTAFPLFNNVVTALSSRFILGSKANLISNLKNAFLRWVFYLIFLPYDALIMLDAIVTTLVRVFISHKRLLQWQTSAHTIRLFGKQHHITTIWQRMIGAPLLSIAIGILLYFLNQPGLWTSLILLVVWFFSPQIAYWISLEKRREKHPPLEEKDLLNLRLIARKTWLYFERFIGPEDHWLPPDHFQEDPKGMIAHRTSPTNIGLMMLSTASAYDFGYINILDFIYRMNYTFETLDDLEKYRGHLFNWYDTQKLTTLSPRYVSTVDSGNYAMSLIGLNQTLIEVTDHPLCPETLFQGLFDSLEIFSNLIDTIEDREIRDAVESLESHCRNLQIDISEEHLTDHRIALLLKNFEDRFYQPMNAMVKQILSSEKLIDPLLLRDLRYWSDSIFQHLNNIRRQIGYFAPWLEAWQKRPEFIDAIEDEDLEEALGFWRDERSLQKKIAALPEQCEHSENVLNMLLGDETHPVFSHLDTNQTENLQKWIQDFNKKLSRSGKNVLDLIDQIDALRQKIEFYLEHIEFNFLFDQQREVFNLGYQVGSGRLDKNHYDLLASEARTSSIFAIAKNDVPRSHWLHMSRPFTSINGLPTLISWNGSMFEYLMPILYNQTYPQTLLEQTNRGVVQAQIDYGKKKKVPWGISESSYFHFDQAQNYQYKGFGIPGLGRKRGLGDDLVISPYASLMAIDIDPIAVLENIKALENEGALGHFGFYESIDYTSSRLPVGQDKAVIKSYMAHHQGMILVALGNFLNPQSIIDRVHQDPRIQSTELLLQEQIPQAEVLEKTKEVQSSVWGDQIKGINATPWRIDVNQKTKSIHVLSNGNYRMMMTESGSGYLEWNDIALTRWRGDGTLDHWGIWFFLQDLENGKNWSIGRRPIQTEEQEYSVIYAPHMTEIRHVVDDVRAILQSIITPNDNVCIQKMTLTNQSKKNRDFRILSYGEVVLAPQSTDQQHPAFNKLFIESNYDPDLKMLYFHRRERSSEEAPLGMAHLVYDQLSGEVEYESNRELFIGRGHSISNPKAIDDQKSLSNSVGITLDPIFSLGKRITLEPNQTKIITYITIAAEKIEKAQQLAKKYDNDAIINNAFTAAESYHEKLLRSLEIESDKTAQFQELLSHTIYPIPELRPDPEILEKNKLGQSGLWAFGVSGDYPILLLTLESQEEIEVLQEILLAHAYWRKLGLKVDLIILNEKDVGYSDELSEKIHQAIKVMDSQNWVNRRGGIFVLTANQMNEESLILLKTAANVVIECKKGSLIDQLQQTKLIYTHLPAFVPTQPGYDFSVDKRIQRPENLILDNEIGGFTPDGREYKIFLEAYPKLTHGMGQITPAPWINVISNRDFGFLVSESGGGFSWAFNSGENRLSPWRNDPISDLPGEALYLRDEITGKIWSPTPLPAGKDKDYLVTHGQGYTVFESYNQGFQQKMKLFTSPNSPVKVIELSLINHAQEARRITATYFIEWVLSSNRDSSKKMIVPDYDNASGTLLARNPYSAEFPKHTAFLTSNQPVHGLTTDRGEFLGTPGDLHVPAGLRRIGLSGKVETSVDGCAALQSHLNFEPGETQTITFVLGEGKDIDQAKQLAQEFSNTEAIANAWEQSQDYWDSYLSKLTADTPDPRFNFLINRWLPYQALSCRIWGRSAFYQSSGAYGFRDQLQDVTSVLPFDPDISREHILRSAKHQFKAGDVLHWWHPPSGRGVRTRITDDLLWLVYVTAEYVLKTGDQAILNEEVPFLEGPELEENEHERYGLYQVSEEKASLLEHCRRALAHADTQGPHGLPLIGSGDWNDGMNRVGIEGQGESVWLAWFLYENHHRFAFLCEQVDDKENAEEHRQRADQIKEVINQTAWDDDWFLRAYYDDGTPLGSHRNEECKIDSLPQSWAVLTNGTSLERQKSAIDSVREQLVWPEQRLIKLFTPPFDKTEKDPGYIKGYPPGIRENGGQYTHAAIWAVLALTKLGYGTDAYRQFDFLNPISHSMNLEQANRYVVEPYVVAADIYSTAPHISHGGWTWYTGSSGWLFRLGMEAILGFKLQGETLQIDPCIPKTWDGYKITYKYNHSAYHIHVKNPDHVETGVKYITVNGDHLDQDRIPLKDDLESYEIEVVLGQPD